MVDREKVIKGFTRCQIDASCAFCPYSSSNTCITVLHKDVLEVMKEQPEIIRCKDCMYYDNDSFECKNDDIDILIHHCGCYPVFTPNPYWFCAYGEKKVKRE